MSNYLIIKVIEEISIVLEVIYLGPTHTEEQKINLSFNRTDI